MECRLLPATYQAHVGRLMSSGAGSFSPSRDEDIDYQSRLLGTARVEMVILAQTSASLFAEDYDDVVTKRISDDRQVRIAEEVLAPVRHHVDEVPGMHGQQAVAIRGVRVDPLGEELRLADRGQAALLAASMNCL